MKIHQKLEIINKTKNEKIVHEYDKNGNVINAYKEEIK